MTAELTNQKSTLTISRPLKIYDRTDGSQYVVFKGKRLSLSNFMKQRIVAHGRTWQGYADDTFFSRYLIQIDADNETAVIGWQFSN